MTREISALEKLILASAVLCACSVVPAQTVVSAPDVDAALEKQTDMMLAKEIQNHLETIDKFVSMINNTASLVQNTGQMVNFMTNPGAITANGSFAGFSNSSTSDAAPVATAPPPASVVIEGISPQLNGLVAQLAAQNQAARAQSLAVNKLYASALANMQSIQASLGRLSGATNLAQKADAQNQIAADMSSLQAATAAMNALKDQNEQALKASARALSRSASCTEFKRGC